MSEEPAHRAVKRNGSLSRRMIGIAAIWIVVLLAGGGFALDRVLSSAITQNFDDQLEYVLRSLLVSAEIGPEGEVIFNREPADQRFLDPYSGERRFRRDPCGIASSLLVQRTTTARSISTTASSSPTRRSASSNAM